MRDISSWYEQLAKEVAASGIEDELDGVSLSEFFALELGLNFLADHLPGQPIGVLRMVLSKYAVTDPETAPMVRRLRQLMGDAARGGHWRERLNDYRKIPVHLRGFERTDDPEHRVGHKTVFERRPSPYLVDRFAVYRDVLTRNVPYQAEPVREPAAPGSTCWFRLEDGTDEYVRFPDWLPSGLPLRVGQPVQARRRRPFPVTREQLAAAFAEMDERLKAHPEVANRNFCTRRLNFATVDTETGQVTDGMKELVVDGVLHGIGLMNSGKSTLLDGLTYVAVGRGMKVGVVLRSVGDVLAKVNFLRALGIKAVPLFGQSGRAGHADNYWRTTLHDGDATFPTVADPAAEYTAGFCPLEQLRRSTHPDRQPLKPEEYPCRGKLRDIAQRRKLFDCPMADFCPHRAAERAVTDADVWVTTTHGLLKSRAQAFGVRVRNLERAQHELDLLLVDEADGVQQDIDGMFLQNEVLTLPRRGWSDRTRREFAEGLDAKSRLPLLKRNVDAFDQWEMRHNQAIGGLYRLLMADTQDFLAKVVGEGPFSGHSLLLRLSRAMFGLTGQREKLDDAPREEAARAYFQSHFEGFVTNPFEPGAAFAGLLDSMTSLLLPAPEPHQQARDWLKAHWPSAEDEPLAVRPDGRLDEYARLLQAGIRAAGITTSFFTLQSLYPSVAAELSMSDSETFWMHQPPRDLLPFVPEQAMGNLMALQWKADRDGASGSLGLLWLRGVGRWLLHHLHDLLAVEGIDGPNVVLTSATSHMPASPKYHIAIPPGLILREPPECVEALRRSRIHFRPTIAPRGRPVFVSGNPERADALRAVTRGICDIGAGASASLLEQVRQRLDPDRQQVAFIALSTADAEVIADYVNNKTRWSMLHVVRDTDDPGRHGLARRRINRFPGTGRDGLASSEAAMERGHNPLNERGVAAFGALFYLARLHPPPDELGFPLSIVNRDAMAALLNPVDITTAGDELAKLAGRLVVDARQTWNALMGHLIFFSRLDRKEIRDAFVANMLVSMYQTSGRGIRGNVPVLLYLCDAAFAPRNADPNDDAEDTVRTSVLVAGQALLKDMLAPPPAGAAPHRHLEHALNTTIWGLLGHMLDTIDWG